MKKGHSWFVLAVVMAAFGAFLLLISRGTLPRAMPSLQWDVPSRGSLDWWLLYCAGWIYVATGIFLLVNGLPWLQEDPALRAWIREALFLLLLALFLIPLNLLPFSLRDTSRVQILFITYSGPGAVWLHRVLTGFVALGFDLMGLLLLRRFIRHTKRLWKSRL